MAIRVIMVGMAVGAATVALGACATTASNMELVRQRATFDLDCKERIEVIELGNGDTFGASGCGNKATYIVNCKSPNAATCTAIMNSDAKAKD